MSGLFSTFNIGKRGLFAQQSSLNVTSHNISNANTEGYSRQRAQLETTRPFGMPSMDSMIGPGQIGTGVEVSIIQRVRDEFMDFQVRREKSTLGQYAARDKYLSEVESIFNEPTENGISTLFVKFFNSWDDLSRQPENSNARTVVVQQAAGLANELNHTYNQLVKVKENAHESIKQSIFDINGVLNRIDKLNQQIMSVKISGMEPNDLMDERDLLLDQLSEKFNINVEKDGFYSINLKPDYTKDTNGTKDIVNPHLVRKNPNDAVRRFSYVASIVPSKYEKGTTEYTITYLRNGDKDKPATMKVTGINSEDEYKRLEQCRVIWSQSDKNDEDKDGFAIDINGGVIENKGKVDFKDLALFELKQDKYRGELKGYMSVQKDVDEYIDQLDKLAKALAFSVNAIHSGQKSTGTPENPSTDNINADYMPFFVNNDTTKYKLDGTKHILYEGADVTNLKDTLDGEVNITAGNISINKQLIDDVMQIKTGKKDDKYALTTNNKEDGEKDGKRALAISQLRDTLLKIQDINKDTKRDNFVTNMILDDDLGIKTIKSDVNGMKIDNYFKDTVDRLGIQEQEAKRVVKNQENMLKEFQQRRDSISGVSLDEEMANLVQFQHAYQANAKVIATVDELLDVVINGLKR